MSDTTQIYIGDLTRAITEDDIRHEFRQFGAIKDVSYKGRYAFVDYEERSAA